MRDVVPYLLSYWCFLCDGLISVVIWAVLELPRDVRNGGSRLSPGHAVVAVLEFVIERLEGASKKKKTCLVEHNNILESGRKTYWFVKKREIHPRTSLLNHAGREFLFSSVILSPIHTTMEVRCKRIACCTSIQKHLDYPSCAFQLLRLQVTVSHSHYVFVSSNLGVPNSPRPR